MAIDNVIKKKIGRELREWIFLGIRTGMRRGVAEYRQDTVNNLNAIKRAIDLPHRARARIDEAIRVYGQQAIVDALASNNSGDVTIAEMNAELTILEAYAQDLVDRQTGGEDWDSLAIDIETNIELELMRWRFETPSGYKDIWSE